MSEDGQLAVPGSEKWFHDQYFIKIEALFSALRDHGVVLSPADYRLAEEWYERGIPLSCALRGIRSAYFKRAAEAQDADEEVRSLSWCRWAVSDEFKRYRSVTVEPQDNAPRPGSMSGGQAGSIIDAAIYDLAKARSSAKDEELAAELAQAEGRLRSLASALACGRAQPEEIEDTICDLDRQILLAAEKSLDNKTRRKIERSIERKLAPHAKSMDEQSLQATRRNAWNTKIRIETGLPHLTLFGF